MNERLLATKFYIPENRTTTLSRPRLMRSLTQGAAKGGRFFLVSAPAGYGKTTLVVEWVREMEGDIPAVWLSLDERDNDPVRFLNYWIAALQRLDPEVGQKARSLLDMPQLPPLTAVFDEVINDLVGLDSSFLLILDDYHVIRTPELHQALDHFVEYQPPGCHLVLTTREDPPLSLPRLRVRGEMIELRARDLRFSEEEACEYLQDLMGLALSSDGIETLETRTEGWAAGLQLAALALQNMPDQDAFLAEFTGSHRYIIDYLLDEVLRHQGLEVQDFLTRTAHLDRFNASLAKAVTGFADSQAMLDKLARANLFLVALDDQRNWYRYHRLFADVLRASSSAETVQEVHAQAAVWLEANGYLGEAVENWLAIETYDQAVRLIKDLAVGLLRSGQIRTLLAWVNELPEDERHGDPDLISYQALGLLLTGEVDRAQSFVDRAFHLLSSESGNGVRGNLMAIQAWLGMIAGLSRTTSLAKTALAELESSAGFFRIMALLALGNSLAWGGELPASNTVFLEAYEMAREIGQSFTALGALANLVFNDLEMGRLQEADALVRQALADFVDSRGDPLPILGIIYSPLASIYYEKGAFSLAEEYAHKAIDLSRRLFSNQILGGDAEVVLVRSAFERGKTEKAFEILQSTAEEARLKNIPTVEFKMAVIEIELCLLMGRSAEAKAHLAALEGKRHSHLPKAGHILQHLRARVAAASDDPAAALPMLEELAGQDQQESAGRRLMGLFLTQSMIFQKLGQNEKAQRTFLEAVFLAAPEGYRTLFLPHKGRKTALLLQDALSSAPGFIRSVLDLTVQDGGDSMESPLPDPLTDQEKTVLHLLMAGKSNREIADALVISEGTAKWHVHNILNKLNARNRVEAVDRARSLGIDG
jgi:LuxR family maltose regulon positive regulatory protein